MKPRVLALNAIIPVVYFCIYLWMLWNVSGGDIALIALFILSIILNIVIIIKRFKSKRALYAALTGVVIGILISVGIFETIEWQKERANITVTNRQTIDK